MNPFTKLQDKFAERWRRKQDEKEPLEEMVEPSGFRRRPRFTNVTRGAFGQHKKIWIDPRPALSPAEMRERYGKATSK
jgi:hypothetical protein